MAVVRIKKKTYSVASVLPKAVILTYIFKPQTNKYRSNSKEVGFEGNRVLLEFLVLTI